MKRVLIILAASAVLFSCAKEIESLPQSNGECISQITASFADGESKTVLGSDGSTVLWSPGDEVNVFYGASGVKFTSLNTEASASAIFGSDRSFMFFGSEGADDYLWAVYPYSATNSCSDAKITLTVPATQTATAASFAKDAFPSIGRSKDTRIAFYNVCGGFCFKVNQSGVTRVVIKSNGGESLAGKVKVGFDGYGHPVVTDVVSGVDSVVLSSPSGLTVGSKYYVSSLPVTLSSGLTVKLYTANKRAVRTSGKSNEIKRNCFADLGIADSGLLYEDFKTKTEEPEYVDLGLSVKWATCNLGATKPEEYGKYFAWGDVTGQTWNGSSWSGSGFSTYPAYELDSNNNLKPEYDAARVLLGGDWRMPTKAEQQELINNCTSTWTSNYNGTGVAGRIFTSNKTGYTDKSIFLPAAGYGGISYLYFAGSYGGYWSSTFSYDDAWSLDFYSGNVYADYGYRYYGRSVRPVSVGSTDDGSERVFSASFDSGKTKTALGESGSLYWDEGQIVFLSDLLSTDTPVINKQTDQTGTLSSTKMSQATVLGGIPYEYFSLNSNVYCTIPAVQDGSFNGACVALSKTDLANTLVFSPATAVLKITISEDVDSVRFVASDSVSIAGTCAVNMSGEPLLESPVSNVSSSIIAKPANRSKEFYFGVLPCVTKISVEIYKDGGVVCKSASKDVTLQKGMIYKMATLQNLTFSVDLGLSVKWATCNLGATKPEEYGKYFAWGDVAGQIWNGSSWSGSGFSTYPDYDLDSNNNLEPEYDAARVLLGGDWRMPTKAEQQELINNCTSTWTSNYNGTGVAGRIFTSNKTGYTDKSIFLPAGGIGYGSGLNDAGSNGDYWSSTFDSLSFAGGFYFRSDAVGTSNFIRFIGRSVRPVSE